MSRSSVKVTRNYVNVIEHDGDASKAAGTADDLLLHC